jgi:SPP1 gp7 family putative phage head morphogenesis protein
MRDLILEALRASVKQYPEVIPLLRGDAALYAMVYAYKVGEAPDDDVRVRDENLLAEKIAAFLVSQRRRIIKALREQYKDFQLGFWDTEARRMWAELGQDFVGILIHGLAGGINLLDDDIPNYMETDLIQGNLIRYARQYRDKWLRLINDTTREFVEGAVADWLVSGDPLDELVKILSNPELGIFSEMRARRIAVTEVTRLNALANQVAWQESGVVREFTWMTAMDERVCDECGPNHGQVFPLAQLDELIPAHPNCRCWPQPIVDRELSRQRLDERITSYGI